MTDHPPRVGQACLNIFLLQPGISLQQEIGRVPGSEHAKYMLDCQSTSTNDWFAAKNTRINRDAFKQLVFIHSRFSQASRRKNQ